MMAWLTAVLCNGLGLYEEGAAAARGALEDGSPTARFEARELRIGGPPAWGAADFFEAAVRTGDTELLEVATRRVEAATESAPSAAALGLRARCRALVSEGDEARSLYEEAIELLAGTRLRPDVARAHLLFGDWLLARGEQANARDHLRTAYEQLTEIGMEAFASRAQDSLVAAGAEVPAAPRRTDTLLTSQEQQIARLAREGMTNPEIGARLFLSPRTVEWHLSNVFSKLGIRSRRDLRDSKTAFA
jgi:DNA-binding NarL/FixJ family response regulator